MRTALNRLGVVCVLVLAKVLWYLPAAPSLWCARRLGNLLFACGFRRQVVLDNLRHVFGDRYSEAERLRIGYASTRNMAMWIIESLRSLGAGRSYVAHLVSFNDRELVESCQTDPRPVMFVGAHSGNMDLAAMWWAETKPKPLSLVMKPLKNPHFNKLLVRSRANMQIRMLSSKDTTTVGGINATLQRPECVCIAPDQNARRRGVVVDFLGKPASTFKGAAAAAIANPNTRVIAVVATRVEDSAYHKIYVRELPPFEPTDDRASDIVKLTQTICDALSSFIELHPESYLWHHRRWGRLRTAEGTYSPDGDPQIRDLLEAQGKALAESTS